MKMPNPSGSAQQTLGRYLLHDEIVSGGMGVVHFGSVREAGRTRVVAIKQLNPSLVSDPEVEQAFLREAGLAVRILHQNVVSTLEVGVHCGELFVVMEYIHGESLARLMKAGRAPAPPRIASRIAIDVLDGLAAVHDARDDDGQPLGVVHRDVSPQNVLVAVDGTSFVIDFGIAKLAGEATNTRPGLVKGKLSYMSPEQLKAGEVTPATDLFAAAVVLWEMLTAMRLFASGSVGSVMRRIGEGRIEPPSVHAPGLPPELDALVLRGLRPDPADRFPSAASFAEQLAEAVPPASRAEVADWVTQRAGPVLEQRAEIVRRIEQEGSLARSPATGARRRPVQRTRGVKVPALLAVAAAASALGILAGIAFFATRSSPEHITSTPASDVVMGTTRSVQVPAAASASVAPCESTGHAPPGDDAADPSLSERR